MKKLLITVIAASALSSTAFAADFGVVLQPAPAGYIAPATDWTGFYAGIFGGVTSGPFDFSLVPPAGPSVLDVTVQGGGAVGGAQIGYDVQLNQFVLGLVADIAVSNHRAGASLTSGPNTADIETRLTYLGTVRARAGYAFDDVLAYVHGGLAYGHTETTATVNGVDAALGLTNPDRVGYVVGAGFEYQVSENISLQTEYSYTGFRDESILAIGGGNLNQALSFHTVKAGVNFRF
ncbi:outer membrane protein [Devosia sp. 2618]|uniref:outer membrane protein n=1 Tax=Devosia sp. 2618 TaxID=3156454 RepID=UPI00339B5792